MNRRLRELALMLLVAALLISFVTASLNMAFSSSVGCNIDVFTQKQPYSGIGPNMPSDAFGPEEILILYGLVTYMDWPIENALVAFHVFLPSNASFSLVARTNSSGIASINFTISTPPIGVNESDIFGYWRVLADAVIEGNHLEDSLTFRVDWVVKVLSVRPIDENLTYLSAFGKGGDLGLEITLRSIAMTMKTATIAIVIYDVLHVPVNYTEISNFDVPPNERLVILFSKLQIPTWSYTGNATVYVSALTAPALEGGLPYCPPATANFDIKSYGQLALAFYDAAIVDVILSATSVQLGLPLNVSVIVRNEGTETENFSVSTYFGGTLLGTSVVTALVPYSKLTFNYTVDTSVFGLGNYTVSAVIPPIAEEADLTDNNLTAGNVEIISVQPVVIHDIAVINVSASSLVVYQGDPLQVNVTVSNKGTETETFNVSAFYDSKLIQTLPVYSLAPQSQVTLTFVWDTTFVNTGFYQLGASAPLDNDVNPLDNVFVDGMIEVGTRPPLVHDVAVLSLTPSVNSTFVGTTVSVFAVAANLGNYNETFNVTLLYDSQAIGTLLVENLPPNNNRLLVFDWNTSAVTEGNYTLSVSASQVPGEENTANNQLTDGVVEIKAGPAPPMSHNVAIVSLTPSVISVNVGDPVTVYVGVANVGNYTESFNVTAYYDSFAIGTAFVGNLLPSGSRTLMLGWDTHGVVVGNYTLSAWASPVPFEQNTQDNQFVDGVVEVKSGPPPPPPVHDVAVVNVIPASYFVYIGATLDVNVTVKNNGTEPESFSVFLYYNSTNNPIGQAIPVVSLPAGTVKTVIFHWNTSRLSPSNYTLIGYAEAVPGETNTADNTLTDGTVKLVAPTTGLFGVDWYWFYLFLLLLLLLIIILIIFLLYRRRKKKKQGAQAFSSGFTAWYYNRDLKDEDGKTKSSNGIVRRKR